MRASSRRSCCGGGVGRPREWRWCQTCGRWSRGDHRFTKVVADQQFRPHEDVPIGRCRWGILFVFAVAADGTVAGSCWCRGLQEAVGGVMAGDRCLDQNATECWFEAV